MKEPEAGGRRIILGAREQHETIVSPEDYAHLIRWRWTFKVSSWKYARNVYARRCIRVSGQKRTILMHDVILIELMGLARPTELHTVDHINGDSLDNRRENLRWATKSEQIRNQRRRAA